MEDICEVCKKPAAFSCSCGDSLRFCSSDFFQVHRLAEGDHNPIDLAIQRQEISQKLISTIENLNKLKSQVVSKSNQLVHQIQFIATKKLSLIKKYIDTCIQASKARDFDVKKMIEEFQNIKIKQTDSEKFEKILEKNFSFFKDDERIESEPEK